MKQIFLSLLKTDLYRKKGLLVILLSGIIVTMYCICAMLGTAMSEYETAQNWNDYTSLTVNPEDISASEIVRMNQYLDRANNENIVNIIYLTRGENGIYMIGWDGTEQTRWFGHEIGRFFTEEEIQAGEKLAYVSNSFQEYDKSKEIRIGDELYEKIGSTTIIPYFLTYMIPDESNVHLFTEETPYDEQGGYAREKYFKFIIIPVTCYLEKYQPDQILIQINQADGKKMKQYKKTLEKEFPGIQVCLPKNMAETRLTEKTIQYIRKSLILSLITGFTIFQLIIQWIKSSIHEFSVYHLYGLTSGNVVWMIYGRLLIYYLIGGVMAAVLHRITLPILRFIYQESVPSYAVLALMLGLVFLLICLGTLPLVLREVRSIREVRKT